MDELITLNQLKQYDAEKTNKLNVRFDNVYNYVNDEVNNVYIYVDDGFNNCYNYIDNGINTLNNYVVSEISNVYNYTNDGFNDLHNDLNVLNTYVVDEINNVYNFTNNGFNNVYNYVDTELDKKIDKTEKGESNGVATLDATGRVPYSQLPESAMEYKGTWDASTNTPSLADGTGTNGDFYVVSVAGTVNFGSRTVTFYVNDRVIYDGTTHQWERLPAGEVRSVNGLTGDVTLTASDINYDTNTTTKAAIDSKVDKVTGKGLSENDFTNAYKNKLDGIESGAEVNVQPDWNQTDTTADDYIKNKPTVPAAQVNSDWNATTGVAKILNKPMIDTAMSSTSTNAVQNKVIKSYVDTQVTEAITQVLNTGF